MTRPIAPALIALLAATALSGCVAAVVPAMAGGALLRQKMANAKKADTASPPALPADQPSGEIVRIVPGPLPAPTAQDMAGRGQDYAAFYTFTDRAGTTPVVGSERHSAILADSGTLTATTAECSIHPAAALIDIDPADALFSPTDIPHADPVLAERLAALRRDNIVIGWVSGNTADRAGDIRHALITSGLDPAGHDPLVLLRYPDDRKQTRRADFAREYCVVAIAGDERADFDELYKYLKDPSAALQLEALIGKGWFLIPQPLS